MGWCGTWLGVGRAVSCSPAPSPWCSAPLPVCAGVRLQPSTVPVGSTSVARGARPCPPAAPSSMPAATQPGSAVPPIKSVFRDQITSMSVRTAAGSTRPAVVGMASAARSSTAPVAGRGTNSAVDQATTASSQATGLGTAVRSLTGCVVGKGDAPVAIPMISAIARRMGCRAVPRRVICSRGAVRRVACVVRMGSRAVARRAASPVSAACKIRTASRSGGDGGDDAITDKTDWPRCRAGDGR